VKRENGEEKKKRRKNKNKTKQENGKRRKYHSSFEREKKMGEKGPNKGE